MVKMENCSYKVNFNSKENLSKIKEKILEYKKI